MFLDISKNKSDFNKILAFAANDPTKKGRIAMYRGGRHQGSLPGVCCPKDNRGQPRQMADQNKFA